MAFPFTPPSTFTGSGTNTVDQIIRYFTDGDLPGVRVLSFNQNRNIFGYSVKNTTQVEAVNFPFLSSLDQYNQSNGDTMFQICYNDGLQEINAPRLTNSNAELFVQNNGSLTDVIVSAWKPVNGQDVTFSHNALSEDSVTGILARCVANGSYASGIVDLSGGYNGGTNAGAATAPAYWYVGTLTGRGVTVITN
jgi:hypothetical protein